MLLARHIPKQFPYESHVLNHIALVWSSECTERWKWLRALCKTELFSAKAIESHASLREKKVGEMIEFLGAREGEVVGIGEVVFNTVFNIMSNLLFSKDLAGLEEKGVLTCGLKSHMRKMMLLVTTPYIANFYPIFAGLDLEGLKWKLHNCLKEFFLYGKLTSRKEDKVMCTMLVQEISWIFLLQMDLKMIKSIWLAMTLLPPQ